MTLKTIIKASETLSKNPAVGEIAGAIVGSAGVAMTIGGASVAIICHSLRTK